MSASNVKRFEKWLGTETSAWHEFHLVLTNDELQEFSQDDWDYLLAVAPSRPASWQERCAEAVGPIASDQSMRILLALLESPSFQVMRIVACELDDLSVRLPVRYEARLRHLLTHLEERQSNCCDEVRRLLAQLH